MCLVQVVLNHSATSAHHGVGIVQRVGPWLLQVEKKEDTFLEPFLIKEKNPRKSKPLQQKQSTKDKSVDRKPRRFCLGFLM